MVVIHNATLLRLFVFLLAISVLCCYWLPVCRPELVLGFQISICGGVDLFFMVLIVCFVDKYICFYLFIYLFYFFFIFFFITW